MRERSIITAGIMITWITIIATITTTSTILHCGSIRIRVSEWWTEDIEREVNYSSSTPNSVKKFSGYSVQIYAIDNGRVSPHLKDPHINDYLPTIPSEVSSVNFTWSSGPKKYTYHFDRLTTSDDTILKPPTISIDAMGVVPKTPQGTKGIGNLLISLPFILYLFLF